MQYEQLGVKTKTIIKTELVRTFSFKDTVSIDKYQEDTNQDRIKQGLRADICFTPALNFAI